MLTVPDMRTMKVMMGDGNCLFRSLFYVLTGSQDHHLAVRLLICNHNYAFHISSTKASHISS